MDRKVTISTSSNVIKFSNNTMKNLNKALWKMKMYKSWKAKSIPSSKNIWECLISIKVKWSPNLPLSSRTSKTLLKIIIDLKINPHRIISQSIALQSNPKITPLKKLNNFPIKNYNHLSHRLTNSKLLKITKIKLLNIKLNTFKTKLKNKKFLLYPKNKSQTYLKNKSQY